MILSALICARLVRNITEGDEIRLLFKSWAKSGESNKQKKKTLEKKKTSHFVLFFLELSERQCDHADIRSSVLYSSTISNSSIHSVTSPVCA